MLMAIGYFFYTISDCFTNPKRYSILIARNDLSDADFDSMYEKRKQKINYSLNSSIIITHTNNITKMIDSGLNN